MNKRSRGRKDGNQKELETYLNQHGISYIDLSGLPSAGMDLLISYKNFLYPVEVKSQGHADDLTENEQATCIKLMRAGVKYNVIESVQQLCLMLDIPYVQQEKLPEAKEKRGINRPRKERD